MTHSDITIAHSQKGFSLLVALVFVAFFGSILTSFVYSRSGETIRNEAEITGWQISKIARAARIHVRNELVNNANLRVDLANTGPRDVPLSSLVGAALLPSNFARSSGGDSFTALNQQIRVIMANYPLNGDPNDVATVPTAYVYLQNSDRASSSSLIQDVVQAARRQNVAISAPLFDPSGNNLSGTCNGGPSVVIWDTGCMSQAEFTTLTGDSTFVEGSLVVPAWRSVNFDPRILMRFPQPEGTGAATMLTELEMGDPLADCATNPNSRIKIASDDVNGGVTELCGAHSDNVAEASLAAADRRRDIINTRNLEAQAYVGYTQGVDSVTRDSVTGIRTTRTQPADALVVTGNLTARGDIKAFDGNMELSGHATIDRNIAVSSNVAGRTVSANIGGTVNGATMTAAELSVRNTVTTGSHISSPTLISSPAANFSNTLVTQQMQMNTGNANINSAAGVDMLGVTNATTTNISGGGSTGGFSYVSGELLAGTATIAGNINVSESASFGGHVNTGRIDVHNSSRTAQCRGDCPKRTERDINEGILGR